MAFISRGVATLFILLIAGISALVLWHQGLVHKAATHFPAPGFFVNAGGHDLHVVCKGAPVDGRPIVLFESGLGTDAFLAWDRIATTISTKTKACYYDRAGYGWSDTASGVRNIPALSRDIAAVIDFLSPEAPVLLAGHSVGGVIVRHYANQHPNRIAAMIWVDSSHEEQNARVPGFAASPPNDWRERYGAFIGLARFNAEKLVPPFPWLAEDDRARLIETASTAKFHRARLREGDAWRAMTPLPLSTYDYDFADIPILLLSQDTTITDQDDAAATARKKIWAQLQSELAALSAHSSLTIVENTGHHIPILAPNAVTKAVITLIDDKPAEPTISIEGAQ